ncbi:GntR family transcriptional regulator [Ottowia thiooxydans]|uniref:GntR family transcriptional regulator n=1 Tax=Ottowia thiooxydans TaxID=219182 RepID=UPI00042685C9|nr:GntR family transcriptional regulator [Ottowia thiooxydans]
MSKFTDISRSRIARYLQLATLFRNRIASGEWGVDERIPNVEALAEEFQVARGTIREAMDVLAEEGLIERFRAKGSFVRKSPIAQGVHHLESDWASMIEMHKGVEIRVLEQGRTKTLPAYASTTGEPAAEYEMMRRLHLRERQPYLVGRFYLDRELFRLGPPKRFLREPTLPILHDIAGARIASAHQILTVSSADIEIANLLELPLNAPIVKVHRTAVDLDGKLIYLGEGLYRGDTFKLEIELR